MSQIEILGLVAGMFVALGLVPQILRVWKLNYVRPEGRRVMSREVR